MTKFKGPWFPSYRDAQPSTHPVKVWKQHQNRAERVRRLRSKCRHILNSRDVDVAQTGVRVTEVAKRKEPRGDLEYMTLILICLGIDAAVRDKAVWCDSMNAILDQIEAELDAPPKFLQRVVEEAPSDATA